MNFPIDDFENYLSSSAVQQGEVYWRVGSVKKLEQEADGIFTAEVRGRNLYKVRLYEQEGMINSFSCTCPHDKDYICQHITATLFSLRKMMKQKTQKV